MKLDRSQSPSVHPVGQVALPEIKHLKNINGVYIYYHHTPKTGTFKLELFNKGSQWFSNNAAVCHLSLKMLKEGTHSKSAKQFSEELDGLGSFLEITPGFDNSSISIFGLSRFFSQNVSLLNELITEPAFKQKSLSKLKRKEIDRLNQNKEKGNYLASTNLRNSIFGSQHPYGHVLNENDIDNLTIQDINHFHENKVKSFDIYISGDIIEETLELLDDFISVKVNEIPDSPKLSESKNTEVRSSKFVQSSIKIGKRLFTRDNQDYFPFIVMNELLGGFFGSRLMKNIREEKGLTYGIYSQLYALNNQGYFFISSDVEGENEELVLSEVKKEILKLASFPVKSEELSTVKNYMIGTYINSLSNPFSIIEKHKIQLSQNLSTDFYNNYINNVKSVSSTQIQEVATQYLVLESFAYSIVGS